MSKWRVLSLVLSAWQNLLWAVDWNVEKWLYALSIAQLTRSLCCVTHGGFALCIMCTVLSFEQLRMVQSCCVQCLLCKYLHMARVCCVGCELQSRWCVFSCACRGSSQPGNGSWGANSKHLPPQHTHPTIVTNHSTTENTVNWLPPIHAISDSMWHIPESISLTSSLSLSPSWFIKHTAWFLQVILV